MCRFVISIMFDNGVLPKYWIVTVCFPFQRILLITKKTVSQFLLFSFSVCFFFLLLKDTLLSASTPLLPPLTQSSSELSFYRSKFKKEKKKQTTIWLTSITVMKFLNTFKKCIRFLRQTPFSVTKVSDIRAFPYAYLIELCLLVSL